MFILDSDESPYQILIPILPIFSKCRPAGPNLLESFAPSDPSVVQRGAIAKNAIINLSTRVPLTRRTQVAPPPRTAAGRPPPRATEMQRHAKHATLPIQRRRPDGRNPPPLPGRPFNVQSKNNHTWFPISPSEIQTSHFVIPAVESRMWESVGNFCI